MYGYYDMGWMLYTLLEISAILDIIVTIIAILKKVSYEDYTNKLNYHVFLLIAFFAVTMSGWIRGNSATNLIDIYFLDIRYFIIQLFTLIMVSLFRYIKKKQSNISH